MVRPDTYYLPSHLAFINSSRWLNFWDILYYTAYQQPALTSLPVAVRSCASLTLTTKDFSHLLFAQSPGAILTPTQRENGRKTFTQLLALAHQFNLLVCQDALSWDEEAEADNDPHSLPQENGSFIIRHRFELPLYQHNSFLDQSCTWQLIAKPNSYIENGWLEAVGSSQYARHLLNLWLLHPDTQYKSDAAGLQSEAEAMAACYDKARLCLPPNFKQPSKALPLLQRQLKEARTNLRARGLLNVAGQWDSQLLTLTKPGKGLVLSAAQAVRLQQIVTPTAKSENPVTNDEATKNAEIAAQLLNYAYKDWMLGARLQQLWEMQLLEATELKAVWRSLPKFGDDEQFEQLKWALSQRITVAAAGRQLSWAAVVEMACVRQSKRGQRPLSTAPLAVAVADNTIQENRGANKFPHQVQQRLGKLIVPPIGHGPLVKFIQPHLQAFVANPRRLGRVLLEGWAHVPLWRSFAAQTAAAQQPPQPAWVIVRLLDGQGQLIFADEPRLVAPVKDTTKWEVPLDHAFVRNWWRKQNFSVITAGNAPVTPLLFCLEIEQVEAPILLGSCSGQSPLPQEQISSSWYNLELRLTFFPRR